VQRGRLLVDLAAEAVAHDEIVAGFEFGEERGSSPKL